MYNYSPLNTNVFRCIFDNMLYNIFLSLLNVISWILLNHQSSKRKTLIIGCLSGHGQMSVAESNQISLIPGT